MTPSRRLLFGLFCGAVALAAAAPADARVFVRFGVGFPFFAPFYPAPYYPAPYYGYGYYPPVGYAPPPLSYAPPPPGYGAPPPGYGAPPPAAIGAPVPLAPQASNAPADCRQFRTTQTFDGKSQTMTGRACRQADGSWRIAP